MRPREGANGHEQSVAADVRRAVAASDGIVISTPEYNHGMPGLLKNALDWASRPHGQSVLIGKPTIIISSSPAFNRSRRDPTGSHLRPFEFPFHSPGNLGEKGRKARRLEQEKFANLGGILENSR